jgi:UDP-2,4-diacetamido-2,4,6-trideoxy-beta-L-altropyranose hydrolase
MNLVVFRVDESSTIGFGHMTRCIALAIALQKFKVQISFWCHKVEPRSRNLLVGLGISVVEVISEDYFLRQDWQHAVIVVDGYHFGLGFWRSLIERKPRRTVCIDDFRGTPYLADIVVCYNEGIDFQQFELGPNSQLFLGGEYLLLRNEIRTAVSNSYRPNHGSAIMIAAGGTKQTVWVVDMLINILNLFPTSPIWVLSGRRLPTTRLLVRAGVSGSQVRFFTGLDSTSMIRLYRRARCLIAPASTIMLEAFAAGCPLISGWIADNQRNALTYYNKQGLVINVGDLRCVPNKVLAKAMVQLHLKAGKMKVRQREYIQRSQMGILKIVDAILSDGKA